MTKVNLYNQPIMRLTPKQCEIIRHSVKCMLGDDTRVFLFGSRVDDNKRGGDIDLYIETNRPVLLMDEMRIKTALQEELDNRVDLVINVLSQKTDKPIYRLAKLNAIAIN
jgi:predicted nucleotidyltransferase